jgi:hypothetical protein
LVAGTQLVEDGLPARLVPSVSVTAVVTLLIRPEYV